MIYRLDENVKIFKKNPPKIFRTAGPTGPQGEPGLSGETLTQLATAGEILSGHRVVYKLNGAVFYADHTDIVNIPNILGVTLGAAVLGASVTIVTFGSLVEPTWNWEPTKTIFLGVNGELTQAPPVTGVLLPIGGASSPTEMLIDTGTPIVLI